LDAVDAIELLPTQKLDKIFNDQPIELAFDFSLGDDTGERTELDEMHIDEKSVYWTGVLNHTNVRIETRRLKRKLIEKIAKG